MSTNGNTKVINDLEYDLLAVLKSKSDAVQLYDTYVKDAESAGSQPCVELLKKLQQEDKRHAEEVRSHLKEVMQKGKM
jgi:rubrerythrin